MLKTIARGLLVSTLSVAFAASALAVPFSLGDSTAGETAQSSSDEARVFCYNRFNGRFLHWGSCYRSAPRVYCRNRWSGQFLHWGAC